MATNLASINPLLRPNDKGPAIDLQFRDTDFLRWLIANGLVVDNAGGAPHTWNLETSDGVTAESFVEGQALAIAGTPVYKQASLLARYERAVQKVTGHVRDQIGRGGTYEDVRARAIEAATMKLMSTSEASLLGSTQDVGIASIIDAVDTYAGLLPATVTEWASLETAVGGALTAGVLDIMYRTLTDSPRGASPEVIMSGLRQRELYSRIVGSAAGNGFQQNPRAERGLAYDLGIVGTAPVSFNGIPWVPIRLMTASELYMLDVSSGIELRMQRALEVETLAKTDDDERIMVSHAWLLKVANRRKQGKLTGLST